MLWHPTPILFYLDLWFVIDIGTELLNEGITRVESICMTRTRCVYTTPNVLIFKSSIYIYIIYNYYIRIYLCLQILQYDHYARFHRHSVEVAAGNTNQYTNSLNKRFWLATVALIWTCGNLPVFQLHPLVTGVICRIFNMLSCGLQPLRPSVPIPELHVLEPLVACRWRSDWLMVAMVA